MHETTITLPGAQVVIRVYGTHESQPPPHLDTHGEEVPDSAPGLARCGDNVVELRRTG